MTAARQERKSQTLRAIAAGGIAATALAVGFAGTSPQAATTEQVVVNRHTGLAIDGFDPVAYFVDRAPKVGRADLELWFAGAAWRFENEGNRAAFAANPQVYMPRFGGHDPIAVARGAPAPGHPRIWLIAEDRLYLFYNAEDRAAFATEPYATIEAAERRWPALRPTLVP